ncbi:hypothetical protein K491DRAFT_443706 [Lophiostoma macrostomum CBS 122681]|uniref:Heterokaryon incompatibility domain-containing protein n=1 Tax=Lophiostoma macrostomum CBS 122681 TaxID=1314788 RepID=A0A6A6T841_9PLEO|nr:hypothetical protein K491DRAFT_443706 [Lophiostoma macrostomum CBS 122681]
MRTIYSKGILNIAASRASASDKGMYATRDPRLIRPALIHGRDCFDLSDELYLLVQPEFAEPGYSHPPLNERGWVYQERILSPRVIHFEEEQVLWECCTSALCEMYPAGFDKTIDRGILVPPFELPKKQTCSGLAERWKRYTNLVEHYRAQQFTFPNKDKLAAFAGIAQHICHEFDDRYVAGLLRSQLPTALLWQPPNRRQIRQAYMGASSEEYRCPSWSWAKVDINRLDDGWSCGLYTFNPLKVSKPQVNILSMEVTPVDPSNLFGSLKSAHLVLEGRLLPWTMISSTDKSMQWILFDGEKEAHTAKSELFVVPFCAT